jgi:hypothetical protein
MPQFHGPEYGGLHSRKLWRIWVREACGREKVWKLAPGDHQRYAANTETVLGSASRIASSYWQRTKEVLAMRGGYAEVSCPTPTMKHPILNISAASMLAFAIASSGQTVLGQTSVQTTSSQPDSVQTTTTEAGGAQTTVTSAGTISEFSPDTIVVKTTESDTPVHYTYSKTTTYVDENGNAVSMETVKSGLPVTVYYVKDGDNLVASKVVVRTVAAAPAMEIQKSTTTTTTDK